MLKVYTQENTLAHRKKPYVFKSQNCYTVEQDALIKEIAEANTTITEADALAVMSVLEQKFWNFINEGCVVKMFMGSFRAGAGGTAEKESEIFKPKKVNYRNAPERDHTISLNFEADKIKEKELCRTVNVQRISHSGFCEPVITSISGYTGEPYFCTKDIATIYGQFLKIRPDDEVQGVFLSKAGKRQRMSVYTQTTRSRISFQLPDDIEEGIYSVEVCTNPSGVLHFSNIYQIVVKSGL